MKLPHVSQHTGELTGLALDWAVARAEGQLIDLIASPGMRRDYITRFIAGYYHPSVMWSQAGPIIERQGITLSFNPEDDGAPEWTAKDRSHAWSAEGPTPLIAAMRCRVAAALGDVVETPEELG